MAKQSPLETAEEGRYDQDDSNVDYRGGQETLRGEIVFIVE
jgi:hypothetical protein